MDRCGQKLYLKYYYLGYFIPLLYYIIEINKNEYVLNKLKRYNLAINDKITLYLYYSIILFLVAGVLLQISYGSDIIFYDGVIILAIYMYVSIKIILDIIMNKDETAIDKYLTYNQTCPK